MRQVLVDLEDGRQAVAAWPDGAAGGPGVLVWDCAVDGPLPAGLQIGGMVRDGDQLVYSDARMAQTVAAGRAQVVGAKWEEIKLHRDWLAANGGFTLAVAGVPKWFHSNERSRSQQLGLVRKADRIEAAGGDLSAQFAGDSGLWKTMDGSFVAMTGSLAHAMADAAEAQEGAIFVAAETHRQAMSATADPNGYDFSGGWPAVYPGLA